MVKSSKDEIELLEGFKYIIIFSIKTISLKEIGLNQLCSVVLLVFLDRFL